MNVIETLFNISNALFLVGTLMLIRAIVKNRTILRGFSLLGSFLTLIAMMVVVTAEGLMGMTLSVILAVPTVAYWGLATIFSLYNKWQDYKEDVTIRELLRCD